jgi:ABC-type sugar transport system ATPase subunit
MTTVVGALVATVAVGLGLPAEPAVAQGKVLKIGQIGVMSRLAAAWGLINKYVAQAPTSCCFDEPFAGMNFEETGQPVERVRAVRDRGATVPLVEHPMQTVMRISDRIMVLNFGKKIAERAPAEIQRDEAVVEAYLGREDEQLGMTAYLRLNGIDVLYYTTGLGRHQRCHCMSAEETSSH